MLQRGGEIHLPILRSQHRGIQMIRIITVLLLVVLSLIGITGTTLADGWPDWTHETISTNTLHFPYVPVGSHSDASYIIRFWGSGSNEPLLMDVGISSDAVQLFKCKWDDADSSTWQSFPIEWSVPNPNVPAGQCGLRTLDVRYVPTDTSSGVRGTLTHTFRFNYPGSGWIDGKVRVESDPVQFNLCSTISLMSNPLPVELVSFTIKDAKKNTVELDWTTISEKNNYGFNVQKSADGKTNFVNLGFVPGHGTSLSAHSYSYTDNAAPFTYYRLQQVDLDGVIQYSNTISRAMAGVALMSMPKLDQNYPNPFNPATQIAFAITKEGPVSLRVYDILGREVATLVNENRKAGEYSERFVGSRFASGVYMYVLQSANGRLTSRMILSK
jgi:hypothetical protein